MLFPSVILLALVTSAPLVQAATLIEALQNSGASEYAAFIQSNPSLYALYSSDQVKTVFAPINGAVLPSLHKEKRQSSPTADRQAAYQGMKRTNSYGSMSVPPGAILQSNDNSGKTNGQPQYAVSDPSNRTQSTAAKRWLGHRSNANNTYPSLLKIFTGLGNDVNIIKADIPYDGGLIHIVDDYFTLPESLSSTASANNHSSFLNMAQSSNLTSTLDTTPAITVFIPSNSAFSKPNSTSSYSTSSSLLSGHVIPNFLGYLPALSNGATYTTQAGTNVTVTIKGGDYYVNNAKIIASNQILDNGVAHVVDSVVVPASPTPVPFKGSASSVREASTASLVVRGIALLFLAGALM
ncbi:hypothetical protein ACMFMG_007263 [Clarireedia jacksonii]